MWNITAGDAAGLVPEWNTVLPSSLFPLIKVILLPQLSSLFTLSSAPSLSHAKSVQRPGKAKHSVKISPCPCSNTGLLTSQQSKVNEIRAWRREGRNELRQEAFNPELSSFDISLQCWEISGRYGWRRLRSSHPRHTCACFLLWPPVALDVIHS